MSKERHQPSQPHGHHAPRRRRFEERPGRGRGHSDSLEPAAAVAGAVAGGIFGGFIGARLGLGFAIGLGLGATIGYVVVRLLVGGSGRFIEFTQSGTTTPHTPDYSVPETHATRGEYAKAIQAYEEAIWEFPAEPEPYLRIARLCRKALNRPTEAVDWLHRARRDAQMPPGLDLLVTQELIDLYLHTLGDPRRAIPELAHLCSAHSGCPAAPTAQRQLEELRDMLSRERENGTSLTEQYLARYGSKDGMAKGDAGP